jgi:hypothetical protein
MGDGKWRKYIHTIFHLPNNLFFAVSFFYRGREEKNLFGNEENIQFSMVERKLFNGKLFRNFKLS